MDLMTCFRCRAQKVENPEAVAPLGRERHAGSQEDDAHSTSVARTCRWAPRAPGPPAGSPPADEPVVESRVTAGDRREVVIPLRPAAGFLTGGPPAGFVLQNP